MPDAPRLTRASAVLMREIQILDEYGDLRQIHIPAERPLTVFVDKRELVTLMTLGSAPELLVLGYLRNQRLIDAASEVESITVDWDVGAAAVKTRRGVHDIEARTSHRVVTTGCGQGTVFGDLMSQVDAVTLPDAKTARIRQSTLHRMLETMRQQDSIHRKAGSVHGCAFVPRCRPADVRRGRRAPQRHRHHCRLDGAARRVGRRQGLLYNRSPDQRDGDEVGTDGRAHHRVAKWRDGHGPRDGESPGYGALRPRCEPPLPLLHRLRALRFRAGAATPRRARGLRLANASAPFDGAQADGSDRSHPQGAQVAHVTRPRSNVGQ